MPLSVEGVPRVINPLHLQIIYVLYILNSDIFEIRVLKNNDKFPNFGSQRRSVHCDFGVLFFCALTFQRKKSELCYFLLPRFSDAHVIFQKVCKHTEKMLWIFRYFFGVLFCVIFGHIVVTYCPILFETEHLK